MSRSLRMGAGRLLALTAAVGFRAESRLIGVLTAMATGNARRPAGTGRAMSRGPGLLIITDAGISTLASDGIGCRRPNGRQRGFHGIMEADMWVGRLCI